LLELEVSEERIKDKKEKRKPRKEKWLLGG
jgi:hypothetical protein